MVPVPSGAIGAIAGASGHRCKTQTQGRRRRRRPKQQQQL